MSRILYIITIITILFPYSKIAAQEYHIVEKDLGNPEFLYNMGLNYLNGKSVPKNKQDAYSYILRAARLGHAEAQYRLGRSYTRKEFTERDSQMGAYWYRKAALQKHLAASLELANDYDRGFAKPESLDEVLFIYANILESVADSSIMYLYGELYHYGLYGATVNLDSARYWYNKALEYGNERAQFGINALDGKDAEVKSFSLTESQSRIPTRQFIDRNCLAIIIGNSDYPEGSLPNPKKDAKAIGKKLKSLGFVIKLYTNLFSRDLKDSISQQIKMSKKYEAVVFYYAGHAMQRDNVNYVIPIDTDNRMSVLEFLEKCIRVDSVTNMLNSYNNGSKIIILDACRDNRYLAKISRGGAMYKGLSSTSLSTSGSFIVFATQPGETALDGISGSNNSPFAKALMEELDKPNVPIYQLFENVKNSVSNYTRGEQVPVYMNNLKTPFVFNPN